MRIGRVVPAAGVAVLVASILAAAEEPASAGRAGHDRSVWQERRDARLAEYLGLDAQQKAAIQQLRRQQRDEMKPVRQEAQELRRRVREATEAEKPDARAVGEAVLALEAHRGRVRADRAAFEQRVAALLTPEQKQKLEALQAARRFGLRERGPGRGMRRSGPAGL